MQYDPGRPEDVIIERAVDVLSGGGIIAFPTDTVYGLGCRADASAAVKRIYRIKGRDRNKPLILMIRGAASLPDLTAEMPAAARFLIEQFWPGPLTIIFKASGKVREWKLSKGGTIGIRRTAEPAVQRILARLFVPLATTSANPSGSPESFSALDVARNLRRPVDLILDGGFLAARAPSTVLDVTGETPVVLRKGAVPRSELEQALGAPVKLNAVDVMFVCTGNTCRSPMAEGYFRKIMPREWKDRVTVHSSGTGALPGMPATGTAVAVARRGRFGIESHWATLLTDRLIRQADLIVAMEEQHCQAIRGLAPEARPALLAPDGVPDPIGGEIADYQLTMDIIMRRMPDVLALIREMIA
ncbi:MAG: L-threonylcarbamoyladenylate synthase [Candidatus Edwardsbacteria bacterium]|nr:L-threonylcarbamoyladenylate synthase [Candidatus Edwardsbacteria bacterium]